MALRWGILGTSGVARKFAYALKELPGASLTRVASGRRENAAGFAADFSVPGISDTAADLATAADVDVVYIATPPALHREHALACMAAGKAVLVEKPMAASAEDTAAIIDAAGQAGVFCMEGMWTRFLPLLRDLKTRLDAGEIGELRGFEGSFAIADARDPARNLFRPEAGGGALLHRGIYPLSLACHLLGPPEEQQSLVHRGPTGVDEDSLVILRHAGRALSSSSAGLCSTAPNDFTITGTRGMIRVAAPLYRPSRMALTRVTPRQGGGVPGNLRTEALKESGLMQGANQRLAPLAGLLRGRRTKTVSRPFAGNGYRHEAEEVMARIAAGETGSPLMPLDESLMLARIMERALATPST